MLCLQIWVLGMVFMVFILGTAPSCEGMSASPPDSQTVAPSVTLVEPGSLTTAASQSSRFPPREYSFDPRPNINPDDLIFKPGAPGLPGVMTVESGVPGQPGVVTVESGDQGVRITNDAVYDARVEQPSALTSSVTGNDVHHKRDQDQTFGGGSGDDGRKIQTQNSPGTSGGEASVGNLPQISPVIFEVDDDEVERPRAIVDVRSDGLSGEVSYIIHPDNLPPPTYTPMKDRAPSTRPVAQWRPDIFMKVCCSKPDHTTQPYLPETSPTSHVKSNHTEVSTLVESTPPNEGEVSGEYLPSTEDQAKITVSDTEDKIPEEDGEVEEEIMLERNDTSSLPDIPSNHTPRYEESPSSTYQDVTNFLKDIASSEGFKNAFLGDLIKNFGNLDQNAMKLIYSLLIRPLEGAQSSNSKQDRLGETDIHEGPSQVPVTPKDFIVLDEDRLPLRDRPANGYQPLRSLFPQKRPFTARRPSLRPSSLLRQERPLFPSDESWHPSRTFFRLPSNGRRGDEGIDVITAPPFQNFEIVLGSSLNHGIRNHGGIGSQAFPIPPKTPGLPFDKLTLGMDMPPPDALEALPPGSVLIPPSQILGRPQLPQIRPNRNDAYNFEMPLKQFLPNLPFINQPSRLRPPARPQVQDIPPRLPSILASLLPGAPPPRPVRPPGSIVQPPRSSGAIGIHNQRPIFPDRQRPTGPPPPVSKLMPPGRRVPPLVPTVRLPQPPLHHEGVGSDNFVRPDAAPDSISGPVFVTVASPTLHGPGAVPPLEQQAVKAVAQQNIMSDGQQPVLGVAEKSEDYHMKNGIVTPGNPHEGHEPPVAPAYYSNIPPEYIPDYYDFNYHEYYHDQMGDTRVGEDSIPSPDFDTSSYYHDEDTSDFPYTGGGYQSSDLSGVSITTTIMPSVTPLHDSHRLDSNHRNPDSSSMEVHQPDLDVQYPDGHQPNVGDHYPEGQEDDMEDHDPDHQPDFEYSYQENHQPAPDDPYLADHHPDVFDILRIPSDTLIPTLMEQENNLQMLLQNHRIATAMAESNGTVVNLLPTVGDGSVTDDQLSRATDGASVSLPANPARELSTGDKHEYFPEPAEEHDDEGWDPAMSPPSISKADVTHSEHNTSISQLWNNVRLIPLAPELFNDDDNEDGMNLASLFQGAVPLSPSSNQDDNVPDLNSGMEKITIKGNDGHVTITEEVVIEDDEANAKFMAYVLIGACCGLALLSITGVIVILRFKKTCGSRQIKTRTRLTEQESVENISRHVENLTLGGESGHKLGSWFTGRNDKFGSGKLRSNMALPAVHDLKRDKNGTSGSTRDLLSISSESCGSNSPNQPHRGAETIGRGEEEEPRASWLHDEYRASASDLSQAGAQDLTYIPHQYQQQARNSPHDATTKTTDHQRYRQESLVDADHLERSVRERRYTGQSRQDGRHGQQYIASIDSEDLQEQIADHDPRYTTDSEMDDGTTQYDDDESRDPSHYFSDSRELEDVITSRRRDPGTMTSQELGENLSRDLKQYQSRRVSHSHHQQQPRHQQQQQEAQDSSQPPETSSQEVEEEDGSRELRRSQSQVSFSRDNVQNEVFLEFDSMLRQQGQYLQSEPPAASTLGRVSSGTDHTNLTASRANTPDSIDLPEDFSLHSRHHDHANPPSSPPCTPPRFSPPPPPPRPPKPGHLSEPGTPSPRASRARPPSPGHSPPSPPHSSQRPVYWTSEEERLI